MGLPLPITDGAFNLAEDRSAGIILWLWDNRNCTTCTSRIIVLHDTTVYVFDNTNKDFPRKVYGFKYDCILKFSIYTRLIYLAEWLSWVRLYLHHVLVEKQSIVLA